jgi:hypothetical protein
MKVKVYHDGDNVFFAWKPSGFIPGVAALHCCGGATASKRSSAPGSDSQAKRTEADGGLILVSEFVVSQRGSRC